MIQIDMEMPSKCSECKIEKCEAMTYGYDMELNHWCPFLGIDYLDGKTEWNRNYGRHERCPLHEIQSEIRLDETCTR